MAIVNFLGWETGNFNECRAVAGTGSVQTSVKRTGSYAYRCNPTTTGSGSVHLGAPGATGIDAAFSIDTFFFGGYFRYATKPASNDEIIININSSTENWRVSLNSSGNLVLYRQSVLIATGTATLSANNWYLIDGFIKNTLNTQEIRVDGVVDISASQTVGSNLIEIFLGKILDVNGNTVDFFYDDWIIDNAAYPGAGECKIALPVGAGTYSGWTGGTGADDFNEVDEVPPGADGTTDTSYIEATATQDNLDHTFDMQSYAAAGIAGAIANGGVKSMVLARTTSVSGTSAVRLKFMFGGFEIEKSPLELTTTYQLLAHVDVGNPFSESQFNTVEVGMAADTIAQTQRFTIAYAMVWSAGAPAVNNTHVGLPYGQLGQRQMTQLLAT